MWELQGDLGWKAQYVSETRNSQNILMPPDNTYFQNHSENQRISFKAFISVLTPWQKNTYALSTKDFVWVTDCYWCIFFCLNLWHPWCSPLCADERRPLTLSAGNICQLHGSGFRLSDGHETIWGSSQRFEVNKKWLSLYPGLC